MKLYVHTIVIKNITLEILKQIFQINVHLFKFEIIYM